MPSPWRLRVAEASAASRASKMISLSTPFSFETASTTIRISLFIVRTPAERAVAGAESRVNTLLTPFPAADHPSSGDEPRLMYRFDRQPHRAAFHLERDFPVGHREQLPGEAPAALEGLGHFEFDPLAGEAREVLRGAQRPIESRRRDLERVLARNRILDVEHVAHRAAHFLAVVKGDPPALARGRVDIQPEQPAAAPGGVLELPKLVAEVDDHRPEQCGQLVSQHATSVRPIPARAAATRPGRPPETKNGPSGP